MLVVVLEAERVLRAGVVVQIGDRLIGREIAGAGDEGVIEMGHGRGHTVQRVVGDEPLTGLAGERRGIEEDQGKRIDIRSAQVVPKELLANPASPAGLRLLSLSPIGTSRNPSPSS